MVRYVLRTKAPDEHVRASSWFPLDAKTRGTVSRDDQVTDRDRMAYATQGGISDAMLEQLSLDPGEMHGALKDAINSLSKYTHVQPGTMLGAAADTDALAEGVLETVSDFFDSIEEFRSEVARVVLGSVNREALDAFLAGTIDDLGELSTHTQVEDSTMHELDVVGIDARTVTLKGSGTVYVVLQYGSGSDERRGDGASMNDDYPFTMSVELSTGDFSDMQVSGLKVDNSSFFGDHDEEEDK